MVSWPQRTATSQSLTGEGFKMRFIIYMRETPRAWFRLNSSSAFSAHNSKGLPQWLIPDPQQVFIGERGNFKPRKRISHTSSCKHTLGGVYWPNSLLSSLVAISRQLHSWSSKNLLDHTKNSPFSGSGLRCAVGIKILWLIYTQLQFRVWISIQ